MADLIKVTMVYLVVGSGVLVALFVLFALMAQSLAKHDLFFTFNREGESKAIIHNGAFYKPIMNKDGSYFDSNWNVIQGERKEQCETKEEAKKKYPNSTWDGKKRRKQDQLWYKVYSYFMGGGLSFVGIWPFYQIYKYSFRWEGLKEGKPVLHDEILDYIFVKSSVYRTRLEGVEAAGMVPLDIELNLTIQVVNPYKALFRTHQWLEFAISRVVPYIRQYIPARTKDFQELVGMKQGPDSELFKFLEMSKEKFTPEEKERLRKESCSEKEIEDMELAGNGILWTLRETYGVDIQGIEFASIVTDKEYEKASAQKWTAERDKERIEIEASAEAGRINTIAKAEAEKIITIAKADAEKVRLVSEEVAKQGEVGLSIKAMDTVEKASAKPGNMFFFPSKLMDIFSQLGGQSGRGEEKAKAKAMEDKK